MTVKHNGPVEISIKCSGNETGRLTNYNKSNVTAPAAPSFYTGIRQYEGELFDTKNIEGNVANACGSGVTGIQGQGFLKFGKNANAAVKDTVYTQKDGEYKFTLRYSATSDINNVDLYVNGSKVKTLSMSKSSSYSDWKTITENINLKSEDNKIELKANAALPVSLYIDNFTLEGDFGESSYPDPKPLNGTFIKNLVVTDKENASNWSIENNFEKGVKVYGDRDFIATAVPSHISNGEYIRTACDSKLTTGDEAVFTAGGDISVYVALDSRVDKSAASWINDWDKTQFVIKTSNNVILELYKKNVKSGETVTLGTNSGNGDTANYIVIVTNQQEEPVIRDVIKGDVNFDGRINVFDLCLAKQYYIDGFNDPLAEEAADVDCSGTVEIGDLKQIQDFLVSKIKTFTVVEKKQISPAAYMEQVNAKVLNSEPSDATAENIGTSYGTYEKITIDSSVCNREKSFNVLLPAGYSTAKKYPVLYVLHGYWGDEDALLDKGDASLKLRQIIGNAIAAGEAEDMIVVFPDIYASDTQDKCDGLNDKNNKAYDNFINLLTKEIMPYMEQNYSIETGRDNTAITGFSMGGRESLYIGFSRPDLFGYVGAMCPAPGLTTDLLSDTQLKFGDTEPYMLFVSAGSNDTLIWSTPAGYHDAMIKNNTTHIWHYVDGGDHGGKTIRPHIYNFVRAVFKATK